MKKAISKLIRPLNRIYLLVIILIFSVSAGLHGQKDSVKYFKNTIRYNISNPMLFGWKFNVIGYERVIKDYQTASISFGRTAFPPFEYTSDSLGLTNNYHDKGFNVSVDYRFYLQKENRHKAPRGVYIGPYFAYNNFSRESSWVMNTENFAGDFNTSLNINAALIGLQLGYQFVFWDRLTLDLVLMGPGWWHLSMKSEFDTDLSDEDEALVLERLNALLEEKFPGTDFVFTGQGFEAKTNTSTDVMGLRYLINIGFRF